MVQEKPWWLSKTVIGGLVAAIAPVVGLTAIEATEWTNVAVQVLSAAGGVLAIYGRVVAKKALTAK